MSQEKPATFVTFYSFKGGVGRSMALINTAGILAGRGFHVLVIDLDLEAPGLSYLNPDAPDASPPERVRTRPMQLGFVDLLSDAKKRGTEADLFALSVSDLAKRYTQPYRLPEGLGEFKDGSLHIMPAGRFDSDYAQRFDALNLRELYQQGLGEPLIRAFKKKIAEADLYDYVLVDSRTGFSDEAGICTRDLADHLMILSGLNRQNVEGTSQFLKALRVAKGGKANFQIILSPVPNGEDALLDDREAVAKASFEEASGATINLSLQIPYHPQLALTEEPHIFRRRRGYLFDAYRAIEQSMLRALGHDAWALSNRIQESLKNKHYPVAMRDLHHMVRQDNGRSILSSLAGVLTSSDVSSSRREGGTEAKRQKSVIEEILGEEEGQRVVEFFVDHVSLDPRVYGTENFLHGLTEWSPDLAERLHKRIVATSKNANALKSYGDFLRYQRKDMGGAEKYYKLATEVGPKNVGNLRFYADFLKNQRGDLEGAEAYCKRAIEADPESAHTLGDYGQILAGLGRLEDGKQALISGWKHLDKSELGNTAEFCFSLWLISRMQGQDAPRWEQCFKFLIQQGFKRHQWSFYHMLALAEKTLDPQEFKYAKALSQAFLNEGEVEELERNDRWHKLKPLNPMALAEHATS